MDHSNVRRPMESVSGFHYPIHKQFHAVFLTNKLCLIIHYL